MCVCVCMCLTYNVSRPYSKPEGRSRESGMESGDSSMGSGLRKGVRQRSFFEDVTGGEASGQISYRKLKTFANFANLMKQQKLFFANNNCALVGSAQVFAKLFLEKLLL